MPRLGGGAFCIPEEGIGPQTTHGSFAWRLGVGLEMPRL